MKTIKPIIAGLLVSSSVLLAGCNFLDVKPQSFFSEENLFQTVSHAEMEIFGIYNTLVQESVYGRNMTMYCDGDTDISAYKGGSGNNDSSDGERRDIARYKYTQTTKYLSNPWGSLYTGIERANIAIVKIPQMNLYNSGSEIEKKSLQRCYAEALTLRAIFYFDLIRMYGDVPAKFQPSVTGEDFELKRTSRDTIYNRIISDLQTAVGLLPWANEVPFKERITKAAALGLLARTCLYASGYSLRWDLDDPTNISKLRMATIENETRKKELYQIALDACVAIIEKGVHRLNPSFEDIWKNNICGFKVEQVYKENIFEVDFYSATYSAGAAGYFGNTNGATSKPGTTEVPISPNNGNTDSYYRVLPSFVYFFHADDKRKETSIIPFRFDQAASPKGAVNISYAACGKWRYGWASEVNSNKLTNFNYPLLRYSDVLLMCAEAETRLKGSVTPDAQMCLKMVRSRAFGQLANSASWTDPVYPSGYPSDPDEFLNYLLDERARELAFEGLRRADLIRFNKLADRIKWSNDEMDRINISSNIIATYIANGGKAEGLYNAASTTWPVCWTKDNGGKMLDYQITGADLSGSGYAKVNFATSSSCAINSDIRHTNVYANGVYNGATKSFVSELDKLKCNIYPISTTLRDVCSSLTQVPGF